jgi:molybdopterin/thiamine biosynthesis adenylyltransferase
MYIIKCQSAEPPDNTNQGDQQKNYFNSEICNRHILAFGNKMQEMMSNLTIGVVSVGGIGMILIEQLMRLYPKHLVLIDYDKIEKSNLNRFLGATLADAEERISKVEFASRHIGKFNPVQKITAIDGNFLDAECQQAFQACDVLFCGADSVAVRIAANQLALANGALLFDLGVGATVKNNGLVSAGGQIIFISPDSGFCLFCANLYDLREASVEFEGNEEITRQREQGYIRGANVLEPQVYALNMTIASQAIWMLMRTVSGEELGFDGFAYDAKNYSSYTWTEKKCKPNNCPVCGKNGIVFAGDDAELLVRNFEKLEDDAEELEEKSVNNPKEKETDDAKVQSAEDKEA